MHHQAACTGAPAVRWCVIRRHPRPCRRDSPELFPWGDGQRCLASVRPVLDALCVHRESCSCLGWVAPSSAWQDLAWPTCEGCSRGTGVVTRPCTPKFVRLVRGAGRRSPRSGWGSLASGCYCDRKVQQGQPSAVALGCRSTRSALTRGRGEHHGRPARCDSGRPVHWRDGGCTAAISPH